MKIGIDGRSLTFQKTGIGNLNANLIAKLIEKDRNNHYELYAYPGDIKLDYENLTVKYIDIPRHSFTEQILFPVEFYKSGIDIFHALLFTVPQLRVSRSIVTIYDIIFEFHPEYFVEKFVKFYRRWVPRGIRRADRVVAISECTKNDIVTRYGVNPDKVRVIYCAAGDAFVPITDQGRLEEVRVKYGLPEKFILFVGSLEPRKNLMRLLEAYAAVKDRIPHKLVISGKPGWYYREFLERIKEPELAGHVHYTGYADADDLPCLYNLAEIFIYPSLYEGFGLPVLEAMSCGAPVITSDTSSMKEIGEGAALLVDPKSPEDIKNALLKMQQEDTRRKFRELGFKRAGRFSWDGIIRDYISLYEDLR